MGVISVNCNRIQEPCLKEGVCVKYIRVLSSSMGFYTHCRCQNIKVEWYNGRGRGMLNCSSLLHV